uniref:Uncharacterized protein n=1 Tax=viral metagenome TaxID=1070528 RepID=A0A6C0KV90_9ZZZZ
MSAQDSDFLRASIGNSLHMGDSMFGEFGYADVSKQVDDRNAELKRKKEALKKSIDKKEAIISRSGRDFTDIKDSLPETLPNTTLHVIEDYTVAVLLLSYLFMVLTFISYYTSQATVFATGLFQSVLGSVLVTIIIAMIFNYIV